MSKKLITAARARELFDYDPETGIFRWRVSRRKCRAGGQAGNVWKGQYLRIMLDGRKYFAHRLAYLYMIGEFPPHQIDHRDMNGLNNRWKNLRAATGTQNNGNSRRRRNNTSGYKGVSFRKDSCRYQAHIKVGDQRRYLGLFDTPEEAHAAYCTSARELFGEFARVA